MIAEAKELRENQRQVVINQVSKQLQNHNEESVGFHCSEYLVY